MSDPKLRAWTDDHGPLAEDEVLLPPNVGAFLERMGQQFAQAWLEQRRPMLFDVKHRFTYHAPLDDDRGRVQVEFYESFRDDCHRLATRIVCELGFNREAASALSRLEEVSMWANASMARCGPALFVQDNEGEAAAKEKEGDDAP